MREVEPNTTKVTITVPCPGCGADLTLLYTVTAWKRGDEAQMNDIIDGTCECPLTRDQEITLDNLGCEAALDAANAKVW